MADEKRIRELVRIAFKDAQDELVRIGEAAVPTLIDALKDKDCYVRRNAALPLGDIGDARAVSPLIDALKDEDEIVRWRAAWALRQIGDKGAAEPLVVALKDEDKLVGEEAARSLGKIFEKCKTTEDLETFERQLDEGLARLQKRFWKDDDLVETGFYIARLKKQVAAKKNELASQRDLILEDIPKPPPKKKGRMYQQLRRISNR